MDTQAPEPTATLPTISSYAIRHDGWTGEKIATFCEALAETAVVAGTYLLFPSAFPSSHIT